MDTLRNLQGNNATSVGNRNVGQVGANNRSLRAAEFRITDPLCDPDWDRLVLSNRSFNFFHRAAWAKVLCKTYGHKPTYLHFYRGDEPLALVPLMEVASPFTGRRGVSMPFSDFCEPLLFDGWAQEPLFERLVKLARERRWRYFELRGGRESLPGNAVAGEKYYGHKLNLCRGIKDLFARFQSSVRRAIRKAEQRGLVVEVTRTRTAILDFYRLHVRTRKRHGLPPQPLSFFLNIYEEIMKGDLGFVVLAKSGTSPVAGAVFFCSGEDALFKFGASDERVQQLRGSNLVMWEGIKELVANGLKRLHFGRTSTGNEGLRRFKLSWGTEEEIIEYFRFAIKAHMWLNSSREAHELHCQLFRRLPLAVNRVAGALIYPHLD